MRQHELAEAIGVNPSQISRYESGNRRPHTDEAQKIADKLNLPLSYLMGNGEAEPTRHERGTIASIPLPEGRAIVEYPANLSPESRAALKEWLELIAKLAARD